MFFRKRSNRCFKPLVFSLLMLTTTCGSAFAGEGHFHQQLSQDEDAAQRETARIPIRWQQPDEAKRGDPEQWVRFKILGINDFHGQLSTGRTVGGRPVGSAAVLAAYLHAADKRAEDGAFIVHAGDHVGASPPVSALLQDEPSIRFFNMLANEHCAEDETHEEHGDHDDTPHQQQKRHAHKYQGDARCNLVGTLGNHEFDEGKAEMLRLIHGGNHANGPFLQADYQGARFPYVSANVVYADSGEPVLPPYVIRRIKGVPVAFIGAVLIQTPTIVTPSGVAGLKFLDEADAINRYVPQLRRLGVRSIVVLIHQGTHQAYYNGPTDGQIDTLSGSIADIVQRLDDEIDIVVSGHAHAFTNALIPNHNGKEILVVQAFSRGTAYDDIDVAIDPESRDVVAKSARIVTTFADVEPGLYPDPAVARLTAAAEKAVAPIIGRVIGTTTALVSGTANAAGESALGNLIADAQRAASGADFAFINGGGIRADIPAGNVTWGDLFSVQPFGNNLISMDLSGTQILRLLNQQWDGQPYARMLKVSGLRYRWDSKRAVGDRVFDLRKQDGTVISANTVYRITVNSFIAAGGDNFTVLTEGTKQFVGGVDLDALIDYIAAQPQPFSARIEGRVTRY